MPQMQNVVKILIVAGIVLITAGIIIYFAGNKLGWLGHLPGDIRLEKENVKFYFPITTMICISLLLSFVLWIIRKFL